MSDIIDECGKDLTNCGYETVKLEKYSALASRLFVDSSTKSKQLGFDKGHYFILSAPLLDNLMDKHEKMLFDAISERVKFLLKETKFKKKQKVLFVGIGNPHITADSFGSEVINKIQINPFKKNNNIYKIVPNTFSNTGINAYEMIRLLVEAFDVGLVVLFDSLATANFERLGRSIQFNDAGLTPGSALNNFGMAINKSTLNVPCISFGVPTMINAQSLGQKRDQILTDKDIDAKIDYFSTLVSNVLGELF